MHVVDVPLGEVLAYEHPHLIDRLQEKLGLSPDGAEELFEDTKRFLYLCGTVSEPLAPSAPIDECWHHFILFTREYAAFCNRYFGRFLHHVPKTAAETAKSDGTVGRRTVELARARFGHSLSSNWCADEASCSEKCSPSTSSCGSSPCTSDGRFNVTAII
jgi:hypothetical protein